MSTQKQPVRRPDPFRIIRCRVCGEIIDENNPPVDPVECPDECADCAEAEFPGLFLE